VDDEPLIREILTRKLSSLGYECESCENGREALDRLHESSHELVISDITMPEMDGLALHREIRERHPSSALIFITAKQDVALAVDSFKDGAYDFIRKPFRLGEVTLSVSRALERRSVILRHQAYQRSLEQQVENRTRQLRQALQTLHQTYLSTLLSLGTALDSREPDNRGHSVRVASYARRLGTQLGLDAEQLRILEHGALLHDIGKIGVPDSILRKRGPLTRLEWEVIKRHPDIGYRILSGIGFLSQAAKVVLHHQERFDGSGYPSGFVGDEISLGARIFAVVDTLDCMTSTRVFQEATTFEAAREEIVRVSGSQLDPDVVNAFLQVPLQEWKEIRALTLDAEVLG
jgi:putative nucleotidyltransferase with HDIG domain